MTRSESSEASTSSSHTSAALRTTMPHASGLRSAARSSQPASSLRDTQPAPDASLGRKISPDVHRREEDRPLTELHSRNPPHPTLPPPTTRLNPAQPPASVISPFSSYPPHHPTQHVRPNPHLLSASPLPATQYGHTQHALSGLRPNRPHHEINTNQSRPRTSSTPVFHSISELAAHHGIPFALPPLPRTSRSQSATAPSVEPASSSETPTSPEFNFADLCSNYLNMLSQNKEETTPAMAVQSAMPAPAVSHEDAAAVQALMDALQASPEFAMASEFGDYLTSPQFLTSPLESPLDDFLPTPAMGVDHDFSPDILTSPMMDFDSTGYGDVNLFGESLFGDMSAPSFKAPRAAVTQTDLDSLITMTPSTPALDPPSLTTSPVFADASSFATSSALAVAPSRRKNAPNGTRKNVTPETLIPLDAPIQTRKYLTPSATSRKDVPATFARKRARSAAFGDDDEEDVPDLPLDATEEEQIKNKRLQNTLAARRSRKRKLQYQRQLEDELDGERAEKDKWRAHATLLDSLLRSHGIEPPALQ